jgi:hypothetical protein
MAHARFLVRAVAALVVMGTLTVVPVPAERANGQAIPQPAARISPEEASSIAVNEVQAIADGFRLRNPRHLATFRAGGLTFAPHGGGPDWAWQLAEVLAGDAPLRAVAVGDVPPVREGATSVVYPRGALVEQYLARGGSLEQQFVILRALPLAGANLVIDGALRCAGTFEVTDEGWQWRTTQGAVHLGDVRVYDAAGRDLPATMEVTANSTRIVVDGVALAGAAYPVTVDPEIGANDFRISTMGIDQSYDAFEPAVAYNSTDNEYLVVWAGEDNGAGLAVGEWEIFGQRVSAVTATEIGRDFRLSDMGPDGDPDYDARGPHVAYNPDDHEYLVVWHGEDDTSPLVQGEYEIFGQRVAANGLELGGDFRLSDMGPNSDTNYEAKWAAVAYSSAHNHYLVVWTGDDDTGSLDEGEFEIFGQLVAADGSEVAPNDFRLSDMGSTDGDTAYGAYMPALAYNSTDDLFLVTWYGDDDTGSLQNGEFEIYGQRVDASDGSQIGSDLRLSDMGSTDGNASYSARDPAIAYNSTENQFLVVWEGSDDDSGLDPDELEIFGQRVGGATGAELGDNDVRLSTVGPDGNPDHSAENAAVTYDSSRDEYLVVWQADESDSEFEIYGQRLDKDGTEVGFDDFRISEMGPDGDTAYGAHGPAVVYNSTNDSYLAVWYGDDDTGSLTSGEYEVFGKRMHILNGGMVMSADLRLSDMGSDEWYDAAVPAVAYNSTDDEYFVVWYGDDNSGSLTDDEYEIYGRRVNASTGVPIGSDLRLSDMGSLDGVPDYDALDPAVAYNSTDNLYLVVWYGDDDTGPLIEGEYEVFGQLVAADGSELPPNDRRLSDMGDSGSTAYRATNPAVTYNSTDNEFLVVWQGVDNTPPAISGEQEIFGQRVGGTTGAPLGDNDFRLSDMGTDGDTDRAAYEPAVTYNSVQNEYLVVWYGDDDTGSLADDEYEIYGQRVDGATGAQIGGDVRLSDMGSTDGDDEYDARDPAVAYNSADDEYLVVWVGDDDTAPLVNDEYEIFGQRVDGATGTEVGEDDFRLSDMGGSGSIAYGAWSPAVTYNRAQNEVLVVWHGNEDVGMAAGETEIFGQRLNGSTGMETGDNDFRLSDMGPPLDYAYDADSPALACRSKPPGNHYLVVWHGDDDRGDMVEDEFEIFGQRFFSPYRVYLPLLSRAYAAP